MKKIFKYRLDYIDHEEHIIIDMPIPAKILSVVEQNNIAVIYVLTDNENRTTPVDILTVGTGLAIHENIDAYKFIGTVKLDNGKCMWHVFYRYIEMFVEDDYKLSEASLEHMKDMLANKSVLV